MREAGRGGVVVNLVFTSKGTVPPRTVSRSRRIIASLEPPSKRISCDLRCETGRSPFHHLPFHRIFFAFRTRIRTGLRLRLRLGTRIRTRRFDAQVVFATSSRPSTCVASHFAIASRNTEELWKDLEASETCRSGIRTVSDRRKWSEEATRGVDQDERSRCRRSKSTRNRRRTSHKRRESIQERSSTFETDEYKRRTFRFRACSKPQPSTAWYADSGQRMAMQPTWMLRAHWDDDRGDDRELEVVVDLDNQEADVRCSRTKRILLRKVRINLKPVDLLPGKRMAIGPCGMARVIDVASERTKERMEQMAEISHLMVKTTSKHGMCEIIEQLVEQGLELASIWNVRPNASSIQRSSIDVETDRFYSNESEVYHEEEADHLAAAAGNLLCATTASFEGVPMRNKKIDNVLVNPGAREAEEDRAYNCFDHGSPGTKLWFVKTVGPRAKAVGQSMASNGYVTHIAPFPRRESMLNLANGIPAQEFDADFGSQSCCIVKPHAMCKAGSIVRILEAHFEVVNLKVVTWCAKEADTFLTLYRGCVPSYSENVQEMSSGRFLAVHVAGHRAFERLRALCGARDPSIAQILDPTSLRACFGIDRVRNAVHCTDLVEECSFDLNYVFGGF